MDVEYVATERPQAVPYANVTLLGDRAEKVRAHFGELSPSKQPRTRSRTGITWLITRERFPPWPIRIRCMGMKCGSPISWAGHSCTQGQKFHFSDPKLDEMLALM